MEWIVHQGIEYRKGDKLWCGDDWIRGYHAIGIAQAYQRFVVEKCVYTIRDLQESPEGRLYVLLEEIKNNICVYNNGEEREPGFDISRFKKLTEEQYQDYLKYKDEYLKTEEGMNDSVSELIKSTLG